MSDAPVLAIGDWTTNAAMIADIARLPGYLEPENPKAAPWTVLDLTYGVAGGFWKIYTPPGGLTTNDLAYEVEIDGKMVPIVTDHHWDYRGVPLPAASYDVVTLDVPYKLNGTPALGEQDARFGTNTKTSRTDVLDDLALGTREAFRLARKRLLVKCMDQTEGGEKRWQTDVVWDAVRDSCCRCLAPARAHGRLSEIPTCGKPFLAPKKMDRFDAPFAGRPQPTDKPCRACGGVGNTALRDHFDAAPVSPEEIASGVCSRCDGSGRTPRVQRTARVKHSTAILIGKPTR